MTCGCQWTISRSAVVESALGAYSSSACREVRRLLILTFLLPPPFMFRHAAPFLRPDQLTLLSSTEAVSDDRYFKALLLEMQCSRVLAARARRCEELLEILLRLVTRH